jgi:hypothetical protein
VFALAADDKVVQVEQTRAEPARIARVATDPMKSNLVAGLPAI